MNVEKLARCELARERDGAEASIATEDQLLESRRLTVAGDADV